MESTINCPQCHTPNRVGARYCSVCGANLTDVRPAVAGTIISTNLRNLWRALTQRLPTTDVLSLDQPAILPGGYLRPRLSYQRSKDVGRHTRYFIAQYPPNTSQPEGYCLMRQASLAIDDSQVAGALVNLSAELPNVRRIQDVIHLPEGRTYLAMDPPTNEGWHFLSDPRDHPLTPEATIALGLQIGQALAGLHHSGYTFNDARKAALDTVVLDGETATLADLSTCAPFPPDDAQKRKAISSDIYFLARALYWMVTGRNLSRDTQDMGRLSRLPRPLRVAILWGAKNNYVSLAEMLTHLSGRRLPPLRLISGKATHPGQVRDHNEDQFFVYEVAKGRSDQPLPAFYMVADGMGGHEAGEVASDTISASLKEWLDEFSNRKAGRATQKLGEQPDAALRTAIQAANQAVFNQAQARRNNMGATVTAALIVGEQAFIANVGDSRTYLLRSGELSVITHDHSLVYNLYKAGQITLDEVYTHPQRNQIYRNLGEKPQVEVDVFTETLEAGDLLLLCSDGLWEMVRDPNLRDILRQARTPQEAADQLIAAANRGGGEDNISAIVVRVDM